MNWTDEQLEAFETNRLSWDERVETHWKSEMYQRHVAEMRAGNSCLIDEHIQRIGDVTGLSLIHLQCHMGMETLSWSLLAADAVGLDYSQPAIDKANLLRDELHLDTRFVCANVYDASKVVQHACCIRMIVTDNLDRRVKGSLK